MRFRTVTVAGALAVLGCSAVSAPALAAQDQPPAAHAAGLLDGLGLGGGSGSTGGGLLGGALGGLLGGGGADQQTLQQLLGALQGGQAPTGALLAPLQGVLDQLAGTSGLPSDVRDLIQQVRSLLGSGGSGQLPSGTLMPVATLLRDLATEQGVPSDAASLLNQLADALDGDGSVSGLPVAGLSLPTALVRQLDDLADRLANGGRPTGTLLAPVATLLDQVAGTAGLPSGTSDLLRQLGDTLQSTTGALDPLLTSQLSLALRSIAGTPGVSTDTRETLERIATILQAQSGSAGSTSGAAGSTAAGGKARKATARDRAVIKRVTVNKARTVIAIRVACPHSAPATCATIERASLGRRKAAVGKRVRIGAGRSKVVRLRMAATARSASVKHGGRLRVRVTTSFGKQQFAVAKTLRLKKSTR
ncbi:MAG TPA: hypothetical protein VFV85_10330 [Conexibacter sp.]|nr:hypothetical protein [Conexibacter sp.]